VDRIDELCTECFNAVISLKRVEEASTQSPQALQQEMRRQLDSMSERGRRLGFPHQDIQDMTYAIVALVDEIALRGPPRLSQWWMGSMLQVAYFDENRAGEGFFRRMDAARSAGRSDTLRVYYLCLLMGFMGQYATRGGEMELGKVTNAVRDAVVRGGLDEPEALSPRGDRPQEAATAPEKNLRWFWLPVIGVGVAVVLFVVFSAVSAARASSFVSYLESLLR
jgi:type VI secretion system protein ImpK